MSALIVTARLGNGDAGWLTAERQAHFPPERNHLPAHLTMFHALPPSSEAEAVGLLKRIAASEPPPEARISELYSLGRGVAYRVRSPALEAIREEIAEAFHGLLSAQDAGGWRPHVTIQNKVEPKEAKALLQAKQAPFEPRPLSITGLSLHRYLGGPWEEIGSWSFRGAG
ncbi:2'-5' RNA ligase family protein [Sphingomicrobium lutaoense]|uniref:2'-5' RNA ligase n=1 Tax=Sphingomicrobium lutaoense TaxID=515949 RepID=A0A839Z1J0_9SPHN|nr:2'-5' RNA ligase family protein [Sphingomicrobium lutaoense]MBB3763583.1 2'-5' RNA ligase [Sphingomicrobium lutaoense]